MSYEDSRIPFDAITLAFSSTYEWVANGQNTPDVREDAEGNRYAYIPPVFAEGVRNAERCEVKLNASYSRAYVRDMDFGQCHCWAGLDFTPLGAEETPGMWIGVASATSNITVMPAEFGDWIRANLSPGQFVAISPCCQPGTLYVLMYLAGASGSVTASNTKWTSDGGYNAWGDQTFTTVEATAQADITGYAIPVTNGPGKSWGDSEFSAVLVETFYAGDIVFGQADHDITFYGWEYGPPTLTGLPIGPNWDFSLPTFTGEEDNSTADGGTVEEVIVWGVGVPYDVQSFVENGVTYTRSLTVSFSGGAGGGAVGRSLSSGGLTTGGLRTGGLRTGGLRTGGLTTGGL